MRIYIETYGCAANQGDASIAAGILAKNGHKIVEHIEDADILILFTCIVIDKTEQRMLHRMKIFGESGKPVIIGGCMPSALPSLVKKIMPSAALLPPRYIHQVSEVLEKKEVAFYQKDKATLPRMVDKKTNIPISDGCLYNCSYCITKKARGNLTSYSEDGIANAVHDAVERGCREVRITSQDTAAYGMDTGGSLPSLVNKICMIDGNFMVRIGMMHPISLKRGMDEITDLFLNERVYKFLHLPLQSGSDEILKKMRRGHTLGEFTNIVNKLRKKIPDITLATDVIIAFPSETEEQFEETCNAIKKIRPDVINITRFSPRPYTDVKKMKGRIGTKEAKERSRKMTEIASRITLENNRRCIGKSYNAIILEKHGNWMVGKTENYKSVFLEDGKIGEFVEVKVGDTTETHLFGAIENIIYKKNLLPLR
ncbi:MAG: tRNA (N(6)-L-threonylcarbamoyladenosine(37)-C(2))-methylthiotransferase [Candidatus Thermoplasmatota archaeon]|nr:tRNA (N(6)-L-threonylcarbamoyladenosine(37)-C(2))-methylthiotransferase [Candidatus Thermoplasmatota archaeon]